MRSCDLRELGRRFAEIVEIHEAGFEPVYLFGEPSGKSVIGGASTLTGECWRIWSATGREGGELDDQAQGERALAHARVRCKLDVDITTFPNQDCAHITNTCFAERSGVHRARRQILLT